MFSWVTGQRSPLADFGYALGDPVEAGGYNSAFPSLWTLHHGTKKADKSAVSVFVFDGTGSRQDKLPLAKNALRRSKTLRHPNMLPYLDSLEVGESIYIVTSHVVPLSSKLEEYKGQEQMLTWGLHQLLKAITFLNEDASLVHGALTVGSVFLDDAGEFKLGGFEFVCGAKDEDNMIVKYYDLIPWLQKYRPPEVLKQGWTVIKTSPAWATDIWYFGCLIFELYNGSFQKIEQVKTKGQIPEALYTLYREVMKGDAKLRPAPSQILDRGTVKGGFLNTDFVLANLFLENFALKEAYEKDQFFRKLADAVEGFPVNFCKFKVLPELIKSLEFGSAGSKVLAPLMKIGALLTAEEYDAKIVSSVVKLFAQTDRAMRMSLLENLPNFIDHLSVKLVSQSIFVHVCTGLLDSQPTMREATIKSMVLFAPKLGAKEMDDLMRHFAKTQLDEEPGIRTNTTICLGRISEHMNDATKKRVLVPAFSRALKDPFPPGRIAGIAAFHATKDVYAPEDVACRILPVLSPLLVDPELSVKQQAFKTVSVFLKLTEGFIKESASGTAGPTGDKKPLESGANGKAAVNGADGDGGWLSSFTRTIIGGNIAPTGAPTTPVSATSPPPPAASTSVPSSASSSASASLSKTNLTPAVSSTSVSGSKSSTKQPSSHKVQEDFHDAVEYDDGNDDDDDLFEPMESPSPPKNQRLSTRTMGAPKSKPPASAVRKAPSDGWNDVDVFLDESPQKPSVAPSKSFNQAALDDWADTGFRNAVPATPTSSSTVTKVPAAAQSTKPKAAPAVVVAPPLQEKAAMPKEDGDLWGSLGNAPPPASSASVAAPARKGPPRLGTVRSKAAAAPVNAPSPSTPLEL